MLFVILDSVDCYDAVIANQNAIAADVAYLKQLRSCRETLAF